MTPNHFAVYEHIRPDTGEVFYVGKGRPCRVRHIKRDKNPHHTRIVAKLLKADLAVEVRVVADNLPEESAFTIERMRIAMWSAAGVPIVNLTDGGEGVSGRKATEEQRERLREQRKAPAYREAASAWMQGNKNGVGRVVSLEERQAISARMLGRTMSEETIAKQLATKSTPEFKAMISGIMTEVQNRPDVRAKKSAGARITQNLPEVRAKKSAASKITHNLPEVRAKKSASGKIAQNDPAVRLKKSIAMKATLARKRAMCEAAQQSAV